MTAALLADPDVQELSSIATQVCDAATCSPARGATPATPGRKRTPHPAVPEWELPELTTQAVLHNQRILESETSVLDDYWLLGRLLERVRGNFRRGSWLPWLNRHGIDHTRAKRARLLAQVFISAEELRGLTLHEALRIARERKKGEASRAERPLIKRFKSAIRALSGVVRALAIEEASQEHSAFARELATATAAIVRACPTGAEQQQEIGNVAQSIQDTYGLSVTRDQPQSHRGRREANRRVLGALCDSVVRSP